MAIYQIDIASKIKEKKLSVKAHPFNSSSQEAEGDGFLFLRPTWITEGVSSMPARVTWATHH